MAGLCTDKPSVDGNGSALSIMIVFEDANGHRVIEAGLGPLGCRSRRMPGIYLMCI